MILGPRIAICKTHASAGFYTSQTHAPHGQIDPVRKTTHPVLKPAMAVKVIVDRIPPPPLIDPHLAWLSGSAQSAGEIGRGAVVRASTLKSAVLRHRAPTGGMTHPEWTLAGANADWFGPNSCLGSPRGYFDTRKPRIQSSGVAARLEALCRLPSRKPCDVSHGTRYSDSYRFVAPRHCAFDRRRTPCWGPRTLRRWSRSMSPESLVGRLRPLVSPEQRLAQHVERSRDVLLDDALGALGISTF